MNIPTSSLPTISKGRVQTALSFGITLLLLAINANAQSTVDASFNPGASYGVYALVPETDGILVGGPFTSIGGGGFGTNFISYIARLNSDGTVQTNFNPGADQAISAMAVQPDGKIIVAGEFTLLGGGGTGNTPRNFLGRLNPDGTLDMNFNPGANGPCYVLALQPDGKILVAGDFTTIGGGGSGTNSRSHIARLNSDGTVDTGFNPGANNAAYTLTLQGDGKILVGGEFFTLGGGGSGTNSRVKIGRLNADGSIDNSFNPGANSGVNAIVVQPDGKILIGGDFTRVGGGTGSATVRNRIARFDTNGVVDSNFDPGANDSVNTMLLQPDGKIVLAGRFIGLGGGTGTNLVGHVGRLFANGDVDNTLSHDFGDVAYVTALQTDGKLLVAGSFTTVDSFTRQHLARLNIGAAAPILSINRTNASVFLAWTTNIVGYSLEKTANNPSTNWITVTNSLQTNGSNTTIALPTINQNQFFRLKRP